MEIMNQWLKSRDDGEYEENLCIDVGMCYDEKISLEELEDDGEFTSPEMPEIQEYSKIISGDPCYDWLLKILRRDTTLANVEQSYDSISRIRGVILEALPKSTHASRRKPPQGVEVTYIVDWDIMAFLNEQCYNEPYADAIAGAVTLTGSCTDAQALSMTNRILQ